MPSHGNTGQAITMKYRILRIKVLILSIFLIFPGFLFLNSEENKGNSAVIEQGKFLVDQLGCNTCHTPKVKTEKGLIPDPDRLLSGHPENEKLPDVPKGLVGEGKWAGVYSQSLTAWAGPWGVSYAANLTPDKETGIGSWSRDNFISTIRLGIHTTSLAREISPPMPWEQISLLDDKDLGAIYYYLMSIKPVKNKVPEHRE